MGVKWKYFLFSFFFVKRNFNSGDSVDSNYESWAVSIVLKWESGYETHDTLHNINIKLLFFFHRKYRGCVVMFQSRANSSQVIHNKNHCFRKQSSLISAKQFISFNQTIWKYNFQSKRIILIWNSKFMLDDTMSEPVLCIRSWSVICNGKWSFYIAFHFQLQLISRLFAICVTQQLFLISVFLFRLFCQFMVFGLHRILSSVAHTLLHTIHKTDRHWHENALDI